MRGRRGTTRLPPLPAHRARHPAYFYPTAEAMESRVARLREQHRRLASRRERLSALERELAEAKAEVDSACADARSAELRRSYGADTLRIAREAAKEAHAALVREKRSLAAGVAEAERTVRVGASRTYIHYVKLFVFFVCHTRGITAEGKYILGFFLRFSVNNVPSSTSPIMFLENLNRCVLRTDERERCSAEVWRGMLWRVRLRCCRLASVSKCSIRNHPFHVPGKLRSRYTVGRLGTVGRWRCAFQRPFFLLEQHS